MFRKHLVAAFFCLCFVGFQQYASAQGCILVYTPRGTGVVAYIDNYELSSAEIAYLNDYVARHYPLAVRETNASNRYNCHSYAWYNQAINNNIWIDSPGDDSFWQDGSYVYVASGFCDSIPSTVPIGAKVSYSSDDHSAIKASSTQLRSKWGNLPRMLHRPGYSPYSCSYLYYYRTN